jgi:hypothetical protein
VPTPIEPERLARRGAGSCSRIVAAVAAAGLLVAQAGCGEPSARALKNRQELEALLTAIALRSPAELEKDARRLAARHASGDLSDARYRELAAMIAKARGGDWAGAEKDAYAYRESRPYFK